MRKKAEQIPDPKSPSLRFDRATLDNGLELIGEYNEDAKSMAVGFFVRTGSRDETPSIMGVSHFLEHMMFKGTERRSPEDVNLEFDEMGAQYNAFTSEENTVYYGAVLPEFQPRLIDLLSDMMRPSLRGEDFDMEKNVILEEIALYKDKPHFRLYDMARTKYFNSHPLGHSVLGTEETVGALARDQMYEYFSRRYAPNNLCFVLTGNYDWEAAQDDIQKHCGSWAPAKVGREHSPVHPHPSSEVIRDDKLQMVHIALITEGFSAQQDERHAADLISEIIGGAKGSRLYWALVDPGLADSASLYHEKEDGVGEFVVYLSALPQNAQKVLDTAREILAQTETDGVTEEELARAKRKIASGMVVSGETPFGRLVPVGFDWIYRQEFRSLSDHVDDMLKVSQQEANNILVAKPFVNPASLALGPIESLS